MGKDTSISLLRAYSLQTRHRTKHELDNKNAYQYQRMKTDANST